MRILLVCIVLVLLAFGQSASLAAMPNDESINFNRDIRPLLADRCFHCHGPDEGDRQADLRLDIADGEEGAHAFAIEPGSADASELFLRISSDDEDLVMPPAESHKKPLTPEEVELFRKWIDGGAKYEGFWAFIAPEMPTVPESEDSPIDWLVERQLVKVNKELTPEADKRTLLRRLSLDLTGLPPTRDEMRAFLEDTSTDAYAKQVDRLLASPKYGEHMARYWLDLVRFADTNGIHHDHYRDLTPYRDWVIRSFNEDLPYDKFVTYQLAGDLFADATDDQLIASGFNRLHMIIDRGTMLPEESFSRNVIDRVTSVGTAFLGLTVQCAVCHDHKYDPITMRDFYSLSAFFNNIDAAPETGGRSGTDFLRGLQKPFINLPNGQQELELAKLEAELRAAQGRVASLNEAVKQELKNPEIKAELEAAAKEAQKEVKAAQSARDSLLKSIPAAMVMKERSEVRPTFTLIRGAYDNPGEQVSRNTPGFLPPMTVSGDVPSRMDLAKWMVDPANPLPARVATNRIWQQFFGVGLVKTSEDFGAQGEWPKHPELLDYLAVRFVQEGWSIRELVREIVMTKTYKQSSEAKPEDYQADPENRLLARGSRFRMDSEMIRDSILATSGLLNERMFGKSVKPPQPSGLWKAVSMPSAYPREFQPDSGQDIVRRSIYTFWKRSLPPPQMTIFNAPTREECIARRERTNTPLQALLLMNESEYLRAARETALHALEVKESTPAERVDAMYETITSYLPSDHQRALLIKLSEDLGEQYAQSPELAAQLCEVVELPANIDSPTLAAWTMVASTIYNLDVAKTRQ